MANEQAEKEKLNCSFCGKSQDLVNKLVAGPGVYICDECIILCGEIVDEMDGSQEKKPTQILPYATKLDLYHIYIPPINASEFEEEITISVTIRKDKK
jgi:hypothetical protein